MAKLLTTQISPLVLHFKPGQAPPTFAVQVINQSDAFSTFQLEVLAAGVEAGASRSWYQQSPDLSAKIPPGDRTQFRVTVLDVPPVRGGFVGAMTLTVRVFSVELRQEDRQVITLVIEGSGIIPPQINVLSPDLTVTPRRRMEIPVRLYNPNRSALRVNLSVQGLSPEWLTDGQERRLEVPAQGEVITTFLGHIDSPLDAPSQVYPFELEARVTSLVSQRLASQLTVLPAGTVEMELTTPVVTYPPVKAPRSPRKPQAQATQTASTPWLNLPMMGAFAPPGPRTKASPPAPSAAPAQPPGSALGLTFYNQSNLAQTMTPVVERVRLGWMGGGFEGGFEGSDEQIRPLIPSDRITLPQEPLNLPIGAVLPITLPISVHRPWLGWTRTHLFRLSVLRPDTQIPLEPDHHTVTVRARPRLPWGLQLAMMGGLLGLLLLLKLWPPSHRGPVNMVRFDGRASEVLSASEDQTVRRWRITGNQLRRWQRPVQADKAVRVARYRPVGNDAIAVGYENGSTEIISLRVPDEAPLILDHDLGDRVFDLQFTADAQTLFTGYGSGALRRWDLSGLPRGTLRPVQAAEVGFAVQTLALIPNNQILVGGRFNRLAVWDWLQDAVVPFPYLSGGSDQDYITSLATASQRPHRLAIADNQGRISLWDLQTCLPSGTCRPLYTWADGHGGESVRALALTESGCALVSGGADGQVKLWEIQADGMVVNERRLGKSRQAIDTVDVVLRENRLLAVSGGSNRRVKLYTAPIPATCR